MLADLDLTGRRVLVVGGGAESLGRISSLLAAGALVTVSSAEVVASVRDLAERDLLSWLPCEATAADFREAALVVAATGTAAGDAGVQRAAAAENRIAVTLTEPVGEEEEAPEGPCAAGHAEHDSSSDAGTSTAAAPSRRHQPGGRVILVGGGPGDPGLLTVAGLEAIRQADVIVCDRLAPLAALEQARPEVEVIDVGKIPRGAYTSQERINELLVLHARRGRRVVRLKGGDSFVFGRGGEEWQACAAAGIPVQIIPGVTSAVAAPALAGIPVTHRQLTQGFTVVSGHLAPNAPGSTLDWGALARTGTTLVIMMGVATLAAITDELVRQDMAPTTPAATVADAGLPSQRRVTGTVATIADVTQRAGIRPPAITIIGSVAGFEAQR